MSTEDQLQSPEFRQHIQTLLYRYSKTHLTTDYVTFTEDLVSELLQDLRPIPLTDPYSFLVPVDPFQTFSQKYLSSLQPYDEIVPTTKEAIACIKSLTGSKPGPPLTSRLNWTESTYEPLPEPIYPTLTRRSRKITPKLGKKTDQAHHDNLRTLTEIHGFTATTVEPIPEEKLDVEDILKVKHQIEPEELGAVKETLKSTADAMRKQASYTNKYLEPSFLCKIDYHKYQAAEEEFLPIFPRSRAYPQSRTANNSEPVRQLNTYADVLPLINRKIEVEDLDGSPSRQNLVLVDGWETIQSSPPSTPSSKNTDSEDQQDQLFLESSPNTEPPLVEEIMKSKMDVRIPRSRQIGGKSGIIPHILAGKTLQTFLHPLLSEKSIESAPCPVEKKEDRHHTSTALSLVGQAGSELDTCDPNSTSGLANKQDREFKIELERLFSGHALDDMIMKETLDAKQDLLMEVPSLPEPNVHPPSDFYIPRKYSEFLVPPTKKETGANQTLTGPESQHQFLKKVRGKQSLQLALSWVTFTVDKRLPSVFELVGVDELFQPSTTSDEAEKLITIAEFANEHKIRWSWSRDTIYCPPETREEFKVLLNRQERLRLARFEGRCETDGLDGSEIVGGDGNVENTGGSLMDDLHSKDEDEVGGMKMEVPSERSSSPSRQEIVPTVSKSSHLIGDLKKQNRQDRTNDNDERLNEERPAKRPRLDLSLPEDYPGVDIYFSPPNSPKEISTIYDDSGYHSYHSLGYFDKDNKENYPPPSSSWPIQGETLDQLWTGDFECDQELQDGHVPTAGESFEALSLDSSYPHRIERDITPSESFVGEQSSVSLEGRNENLSTIDPRTFNGGPNYFEPTSLATPEPDSQLRLYTEPEIASRSLGISAFAGLRARKFSKSKPSDAPPPPLLPQVPAVPLESTDPPGVPKDLLDQNTIVLSGPFVAQQSIHRYMASLDFIQKRGLVRALRSEECAVELVERQTLSGVDLIIDPHCAVLFFSLFTLPARCEAYVQRVAEQSWNFSRLLIVFEAYPDCLGTRSRPRDSNTTSLNAYSPPIIKAVKKFRRDVSIADACGTKCAETKVLYAFADTVRDAALVTRIFGSQAEEKDETSGVIWGERPWLAVDFVEEEERLLAGLRGMNHFSASIVLCQISLEDFVELLPQQRLEHFSGLLSEEAIHQCNADIQTRLESFNTSSDAIPSSSTDMDME